MKKKNLELVVKLNGESVSLKELVDALQFTVEWREKTKGSYFWTPELHANSRRYWEKQNNHYYEFEFNGDSFEVSHNAEMTCNHVYTSLTVVKNGEYKDLRSIKAVLNKVEKIQSKYRSCIYEASGIETMRLMGSELAIEAIEKLQDAIFVDTSTKIIYFSGFAVELIEKFVPISEIEEALNKKFKTKFTYKVIGVNYRFNCEEIALLARL